MISPYPSLQGPEHLKNTAGVGWGGWVTPWPQDTLGKPVLRRQEVWGWFVSEFKLCLALGEGSGQLGSSTPPPSPPRLTPKEGGEKSRLPRQGGGPGGRAHLRAASVSEAWDLTGPAAPVGCGYLPTKRRTPVTMATAQPRELSPAHLLHLAFPRLRR